MGFPVVPNPGANGANVSYRQNQQEAQPLQRADRGSKIGDGFRVANIAALGNLAHDQMMADKPSNQLNLFGIQSQAATGNMRRLCAFNLLIAFALADIVQ